MDRHLSSSDPAVPARPLTFVLVHGGRMGGWCWRPVADRLRALGHVVFTPTLTGLGERSHLARADIDLTTFATDIAQVFQYENLHDVILVAHSFSGIVITQACEQVVARVARMVYLDAMFAFAGESVLELTPEPIRSTMLAAIEATGGEYFPPPERSATLRLGDADEERRVLALMTPQSSASYRQPLTSSKAAESVPRWYLRCTAGSPINDTIARRAREGVGVVYREIDAPHNAMLSHPDLVTDELVRCALEPAPDLGSN